MWNLCFLFILYQHQGPKSCLIWHSTSRDTCKNQLIIDSNQRLSISYYLQKKWDANTTLASHKQNTTIGYNVNWNSWNSLQIPKKWVLCIFLRLNAIDIWSKRFAGFPRKISYETKMNLYYTWICKGRIIVASPCIKSDVCKWKKQSKYKQIKKIGYNIYKKWWTLCGKTGVLLGIFHYNLQRKHTGGALSNKHLKDIDSLS